VQNLINKLKNMQYSVSCWQISAGVKQVIKYGE